MANFIILIFKILFSFVLLVYYPIKNFVKFLIPLKYKSKDIRNELILITGAGNGLGKSLSKKLARFGARLILLDIEENANNETKNEILAQNGIAYAYQCDVSKHDEVKKVADQIKRDIGDVTILINNAGILIGKELLKLDDIDIERVFKINVLSNFWTNKEFLPSMIAKNKGHIVTTASMAGLCGTYRLIDYCSSKYAVIGFCEALTSELRRINATGIKTTVICPNYTATGMCDGVSPFPLLPVLDPEFVTDQMLEAILTEARIVCIRREGKILPVLKGILPIEVYDYFINELLGTNKSMDTFTGNLKKKK